MQQTRMRDKVLGTSVSGDSSSTRHVLKIDSFSLLSNCGIDKYESQFESCGYKWKIIMYPNGDGGGDGDGDDHISVCLAIVGTSSLPANWEVNATVSFLIFDQKHDNFVVMRGMDRRFRNINTEWGVSKLISHSRFKDPSNGYLVKDKCVFGVDVYVMNNQLASECLSSLNVIQPYKHIWKISEFSKLENIVYSKEFIVGGFKWKLRLYPTGYGKKNGKSISIYLESVDAEGFDSQKRVLTEFSIFVKDQITSAHREKTDPEHWFTVDTSHTWGWAAFMKLSEFKDSQNGFLVEDCCIVEAEVSVLRVVNGLPSQ